MTRDIRTAEMGVATHLLTGSNRLFHCAVVLSSETVVRKLSVTWQTDVLMGDLLKVMREHVMTQYKHYQLYAHGVVAVMKCLARSM